MGVLIDSMAAEGKCVARKNGQVIFISGGAPGDVVDIELTKIKNSFLEGRVVAIQSLSPNRSNPFCEHFGTCGGCSWQHINYATQLEYKQQQVIDNLERIGGLDLPPVKNSIATNWTLHSHPTAGLPETNFSRVQHLAIAVWAITSQECMTKFLT